MSYISGEEINEKQHKLTRELERVIGSFKVNLLYVFRPILEAFLQDEPLFMGWQEVNTLVISDTSDHVEELPFVRYSTLLRCAMGLIKSLEF